MAAIEYTSAQTTPATSGLVGQFFARTLGAFQDWNNARIARKALSQLTDRELEDIGLCRGDIEIVARLKR